MIKGLDFKVKIAAVAAAAIISSLIIGICGLVGVAGMNGFIGTDAEAAVKKVSHLNNITYCMGRVDLLVRKATRGADGDNAELLIAAAGYHKDIQSNINGYKKLLSAQSHLGGVELDAFLSLGEKTAQWSHELETAMYLATHGQTEAAVEYLRGALLEKSPEIEQLISRLTEAVEAQAAERRQAARGHYFTTVTALAVLFVALSFGMACLCAGLSKNVAKSAGRIANDAEMLAYGNAVILETEQDGDEIGRIGFAVQQAARNIVGAISACENAIKSADKGYRNDDNDGVDGVDRVDGSDGSGGSGRGDVRHARGMDDRNSGVDRFDRVDGSYADSEAALEQYRGFFKAMARIIDTAVQSSEKSLAYRAGFNHLLDACREIETPLSAIIEMTQIASRAGDYKKIRECVDGIESSSRYLYGLLANIMEMSLPYEDEIALSEDRVYLRDFMQNASSFVSSVPNVNDVAVETTVDIVREYVIADKRYLGLILHNLLSGAAKRSHEGGAINASVIETEHEGGYSSYLFSISDRGAQIDDAQKAALRIPLEQACSKYPKFHETAGYGLSLAKRVAEKIGGEIRYEYSQENGNVFDFSIRLKSFESIEIGVSVDSDAETAMVVDTAEVADSIEVADSAEVVDSVVESTADTADNVRRSKLNVLIADDIEINRLIFVEMISIMEIDYGEASDGLEAVEMYKSSPHGHYDVIMMDIQMPAMDGCEAARQIRGSGRPDANSVIIVAMTANTSESDVTSIYDSGMDGYIAKPFDFNAATATIEKLCAERGISVRYTDIGETAQTA